MKLTMTEAMNAYIAVAYMMKQEMECQSAYQVFRLKKRLNECAEFFLRTEREIAEKYGRKNAIGDVEIGKDGRFQLQAGMEEHYLADMRALDGMETSIAWERKELILPKTVKPCYLEALQKFFEFGGADDAT